VKPFREQERKKRLIARWVARFEARDPDEQEAIYRALSIVWWGQHGLGDVSASPEPHQGKELRWNNARLH
jgi:hypothetical protein